MKKIIILIPYFGQWPEWFNLYLESCKYNPDFEWLFITDCGEPENKCKNVRYINMSFSEFKSVVNNKLFVDITPVIKRGKKNLSHIMCDLKPFIGFLFSDYLEGYDYWGWGDIDVVYGDMKKYFIEEDVFEKDYEVISFNDDRLVSGSLAFIKNSFTMKVKPFGMPKWRDVILFNEEWGLDEHFFPLILDENKWYLKDSYNTPSVKEDNGQLCKFYWLTEEWPTEWYWKDGKLTNNVDVGREFLYFHFMVWKGGTPWSEIHSGGQWEKLDKLVNLDFKDISKGFKINEKGFHKL